MAKSETIGLLASALSKAQQVMQPCRKESVNPFFKSTYADLASVWESVRKPLTDNDLAIIQTLDNEGTAVVIETMLCHKSGEWVSGKVAVTPAKQDAQGYGAVISYMRRYSLSAIIGGYADDLDAEPDRQAHAEQPQTAADIKSDKKLLTMKELQDKIISSKNIFELQAIAKKYRPDFDAMTTDEKDFIKDIKTIRKNELEPIKEAI